MCKELLQANEENIKHPNKKWSEGYEKPIHKRSKYKQPTDLRKTITNLTTCPPSLVLNFKVGEL